MLIGTGIRSLGHDQVKFAFKRLHTAVPRLPHQPRKPAELRGCRLQMDFCQNQQCLQARNQLQRGRWCLYGLWPTKMTQDAGERFTCQFGTPLLQPEVTAHQQQHPPVNQLRHMVQLHQTFRFA
ncbi:hypothetical protein D3C85_1261980 [compost metagenome]